jgi:C4-dicarboxylate-binding protein DctP
MEKRLRKGLLFIAKFCLLAVLLLIPLAVSCSSEKSEKKVFSIKFSHVTAVDTPKGKAAEFFKQELERLSGGRVKVSVYPNSQLYRDNDAVSALLMNSVQIICPSTAKLTTIVPEFQVVDLPYLFPSRENVHAAFDGRFGSMLAGLLEKKGYKLLSFWDGGYKQLGNNSRPIHKPSGAKGLKFRIMSSKVLEAQFLHINANPQIMPFSEVYTALEQGVIDGQENTWFNIYTQKFHEVQKYVTETNHGYLGYVLLTSRKFWNSLPSDLQKSMAEAVKKATVYERKISLEIDLRDKKKILEAGKTEITTLSGEEKKIWIATFRGMYSQYPQWDGLIKAATAQQNPF